MQFGVAYTTLSKKFEEHGKKIVQHTSWFLVSPILLSLLFSTGLQKLRFDLEETQLVQSDGVIGKYQSHLKKLFPMDTSSEFDPGRSFEICKYGTIIIQAVDKGSILRESIFGEIIRLDRAIRNFTFNDYDQWNYENVCAKSGEKCFGNRILLLGSKIEEIENGTILLKYPVGELGEDYDLLSLGGVRVDQNGYIISARSLRLVYFLDDNDEWKNVMAVKWEKAFIDKIEKMQFENIRVDKDISTSLKESKIATFSETRKLLPYSIIFMFLFTILTSLTPDFLRSKPWTGIMSAFATGMSLASGFGLLSYLGLNSPITATLVPFLVLGVGMDDTFVMLSAWKKTNTRKCLEERIAQTFYETGVSITITSLTNIASFLVGMAFTSWPIYRKFCIFMAVCLTFDYIYQITFVGAVLALCGRAEERRLHSMVFLPLERFSTKDDKTNLRSLLCYVKSYDINIEKKKNVKNFITDFWLNVGNFMTKSTVKALVIFLYLIYLGIACWGFSKYSCRAMLETTLIRGSYRFAYYNSFKENYHHYQYRLQLFITEELEYADPDVQDKVIKMIQNLETDPLIAGSLLTESWLSSYLAFLSDRKMASFLTGYNLTNSEDFIYLFQNLFLQLPMAKRFRQDVAFDQNYTKIISSRFLFQTNITIDADHFYRQLANFKKRLENAPYSFIVYHPLFYYFDIVDSIPSIAIQTFSTVLVAVFLISALLLPTFTCIVCVLVSIISVGGGVIGYMFLWNVDLNVSSITVLIVVIGFSVDYAAHVSCAYVNSNDVDPNNRLVKTITLTGMPILQGSISTILAVVIFQISPLLDIMIPVKIIILSCVIAAFHGILFLPVIMTLINSGRKAIYNYKMRRKERKHENTKGKETCLQELRTNSINIVENIIN